MKAFSDLGVVSLLSQQTVTKMYEFVRSFFALCFGSSHSRMEVSPHAIRCQSVCFHYSANNTLVVCQQQAQYRASNLFICGEKGQANTLALMLEVLYLSTDPDIWVV